MGEEAWGGVGGGRGGGREGLGVKGRGALGCGGEGEGWGEGDVHVKDGAGGGRVSLFQSHRNLVPEPTHRARREVWTQGGGGTIVFCGDCWSYSLCPCLVLTPSAHA